MEDSRKTWADVMTPFSQFWLESSTQAWKNWFELLEQGAGKVSQGNSTLPFQAFSQQAVEAQDFYARLLKLSFDAWQTFWPQLAQGETAQLPIQAYLEQLQQQIQAYASQAQTLQGDVNDLWQTYLKEMQKFSQVWMGMWQGSLTPLGQLPQGGIRPLLDLNNLYWETLYGQGMGSLVRSPLLGPSREFNGKLLRAFDDWVALYRAMADYQLLEAEIQYQGFVALMEKLVEQAKQDKPVKTWREFQTLWAIVADDVFEKAFCKAENLKIRGRFINALNRYRLHQQGLLEELLKSVNLPTRSEVDEIHQSLYQLRKEVKHLKKQLAVYESSST